MGETGKLYTPAELAKYLGIAVRTLHNWRCQKKGPSYLKLASKGGKVRYRSQDVEQWLAAEVR